MRLKIDITYEKNMNNAMAENLYLMLFFLFLLMNTLGHFFKSPKTQFFSSGELDTFSMKVSFFYSHTKS